jgi:Leucine-rich repeat (LRR) protein
VALYDATNGDQWKNNSNWLIDPVSTWYGITLQGDRVYLINLYDNGLEGFIPEEIGDLTGLVELDLSMANFTGGIPNVFWDMPNFYQLSLRYCGLTGEIPSSLSSCPQFARLTLSGNQLTGTIPPSLVACSELIHLLLYDNNLSGPFPPVIESFEHLEQLEISRNDFTGTIPDWIASLEDLWWLFIDDNHFSGQAPFLGDKPNLEYLNISKNLLTGHLEDILGAYPNLKYCTIENTQISGHLSKAHFNPAKMINLEVENNLIESMDNFTAWQNQSGFQRLEVGNNRLDYDDLLPSSGLPSNRFFYTPQKPIGVDTVITLLPGDSYTILSPMQDQDIIYQWYFNQMPINGPDEYDLIIDPFTPQSAGDFHFTATHPSLPNVVLESAVTTLVEGTTAVDVLNLSTPKIFPNPATDFIIIESEPSVHKMQLHLYTVDGQLLNNFPSHQSETIVSMKGYAAGIYFLKWTSPGQSGFEKIVKR